MHIFIGEQDVIDLKKLFGRGQFYDQWETPFSQKEHERLASLGFELTYMEDFYFDQYYASYFDLDLFLQSVPIFEDFDSKKDQISLETYVAKFRTEKGIRLPRHVIVSVAKKTYKVPHNPA